MSIRSTVLRWSIKIEALVTKRSPTDVALDHAIRRWEKIAMAAMDKPLVKVEGMLASSASKCALCAIHRTSRHCGDCPVREKTKLSFCEGTAFSEASRSVRRGHRHRAIAGASEMLRLLISLRKS